MLTEPRIGGLPTSGMFRALFLGRDDAVAMLAAYFDESGTHESSELVVLGALISPVFQWERLERSWRRVLESEGLAEFHMVDCAHGVEAFESWSKERRHRIVKRLVALITRHVLWRTWVALMRHDFFQLFRAEGARYEYMICTAGCASRIVRLATARETLIPYFFERGGRGGKLATAMLRHTQQAENMYQIGAVRVAARKNLIPLQAADIHAYEVYKHFSDQIAGKPRMRKSFWELLSIAEAGGGGYMMMGEKLVRWRDGIKNRERPIQIGVDQLNRNVRFELRPNRPPEVNPNR